MVSPPQPCLGLWTDGYQNGTSSTTPLSSTRWPAAVPWALSGASTAGRLSVALPSIDTDPRRSSRNTWRRYSVDSSDTVFALLSQRVCTQQILLNFLYDVNEDSRLRRRRLNHNCHQGSRRTVLPAQRREEMGDPGLLGHARSCCSADGRPRSQGDLVLHGRHGLEGDFEEENGQLWRQLERFCFCRV